MNSVETMRSEKDFWFACTDIDVIRDKTLSPMSKYVFSVLCTFANLNNRTCWPSVETVADAAGVSAITVRRAYKELEARGVIIRSARFKDGAQISSQYFIVGHNAECYQKQEGVSQETEGAITDDSPPLSQVIDRTIPMKDIYNTLKGENEFPAPDPEEVCTLDDVPEAMKETAELLLLKTKRKNLTWEEISALRELNRTQYPSRVQKEINRIIQRFKKHNRPLKFLSFVYIAGCLRNQPTLGKKSKSEKDSVKQANEDLSPKEIPPCSDSEAEAEMAELERMQAKLREERKF